VSNRKILIFFILFININLVFTQSIKLTGILKDTSAYRLSYANIIAFPQSDDSNVKFAISNENGEYRLHLEKDITYSIEVSYLGYQKLVFEHTATQNETKNLVLKPATNQLDEVTVEYKIPIEVKEDTITYQTDTFVDGNERKLREVLKKLPGIEVDREGNVTAQGKKITKVLVEDKVFFTGNSKLAVNNIPADAVDEVQVLDNYNEIGFLKGLQDSDDMALNIQLKEDKKKFAFGDVEAAAGPDERYLLHPNLFYYSPKTNINFIGDLNNVGTKSFTLGDYLEFNGGFGRLMGDMGSFFRLSNDDFSQFLLNNDFRENTNRFGAFNLRQSLSSKTDLNSFVIANTSDTETEIETLNTYNTTTTPFDENRNQTNRLKNFFVLGKLTLDYEPSTDADLSANTFIKFTRNNSRGSLTTQSPQQNTFFNTINDVDALDLKQNLEYSKRFSRAQTLSFESTLAHSKSRPQNEWQTDRPFLEGLVPLQEEDFINVAQQKETTSTSFDAILKDYWVLNNYNHIYTTLGINLAFENYLTQEEQLLSNGAFNDFSRTMGFECFPCPDSSVERRIANFIFFNRRTNFSDCSA